jgi:hypothetical protein
MKATTFFGLMAPLAALACSAPSFELDFTHGYGPVAHDANEAWPDAPTGLPVLTRDELLRACATAGACDPEVMGWDLDTRLGLVEICVDDLIFSAERAIPISKWGHRNERAEFWVRCVLDHETDCSAVSQCATDRDARIDCQEDGCSSEEELIVSCTGTVATLKGESGSKNRDCARAFASCDPESPTGCTDRHYSACPADISKKDRCDGDIRLGCDQLDQVSYHDCSRLGGTCGTAPDGSQDCVYPGPKSADCGENPLRASCDGSTLSACVLGARVQVATPLCGK